MERVKVIIPDKKFIPTIGRGPILSPIKITLHQVDILKAFGINYKLIGEEVSKIKEEAKIENPEPIKEDLKELEQEDIDSKDEIEEDLYVEPNENETVIEDTEEISEDINIDEMKKEDLKKELSKRGIEFKYNDKIDTLKDLLKKNL